VKKIARVISITVMVSLQLSLIVTRAVIAIAELLVYVWQWQDNSQGGRISARLTLSWRRHFAFAVSIAAL